MNELPFTFRVNELKEFIYCPRILYYQTVLPDIQPTTHKMEEGRLAHEEIKDQEQRRSLKSYRLTAGQRHFNVPVYSEALKLSGKIDMVIETDDEIIPVEFKNSQREGPHYRLQLTAYGRLLQLADPKNEKSIKRGFIYLIPNRKALEITFTPRLQQQLDEALKIMHTIATTQRMPAPTPQRPRCVDCQYRRFCNDIF